MIHKGDLFTAGTLITIAIIVINADALATINPSSGLPDNVIYHYQGLIAGAIAIAAAFIGGYYINKQIRNQQHEKLQRAAAKEDVFATATWEYTHEAELYFDKLTEAFKERPDQAYIRVSDDILVYKPAELPSICDAWEYYAELPPETVSTCLDIRMAVRLIKMAIDSFEPVITRELYKEKREIFDELHSEIEKGMKKLNC